jgi:hypothetical protein
LAYASATTSYLTLKTKKEEIDMEDHTFNSAFYGNVTIKCRSKIWRELEDGTCEKLAALINGDAKEHHTAKMRGEPGEGYEGYVHNYGDNQLASYKDVNNPSGSITVMKIGKVNASVHVF